MAVVEGERKGKEVGERQVASGGQEAGNVWWGGKHQGTSVGGGQSRGRRKWHGGKVQGGKGLGSGCLPPLPLASPLHSPLPLLSLLQRWRGYI